MTTAQCPLCQTSFPAPKQIIPTLYVPPPSAEVVRPAPLPDPVPLPDPSDPFPSDADSEAPEVLATRRAINTAAGWLKWTGILGLTQLFLCGCCDLAEQEVIKGRGAEAVLASFLARFVAFVIVLTSVESFRQRRNVRHVQIAAITAVVLGLYLFYRSRLWWIEIFRSSGVFGPTRFDPKPFFVFALLHTAMGTTAMVAGIKTWLLLRRRDVRAMFLR